MTISVECSCPSGYDDVGGSCYAVLYDGFTWPEAKTMCETLGGYLLEINDGSEHGSIKTWLAPKRSSLGSYVYIGGTNVLVTGQWMFPNTFNTMNYTNWAPGQPDNADSHEHCLSLVNEATFAYNDLPCTRRENSICETE
ncbi:hypothetical protein ScPMuIL_016061 [Solemya velum]